MTPINIEIHMYYQVTSAEYAFRLNHYCDFQFSIPSRQQITY